MNLYKHILVKIASIIICISLWIPSLAQNSVNDLWIQGENKTKQAIESNNLVLYLDGLKLMEKAFKKNKNGDWCYKIGSCYYYLKPFGDNGRRISLDREKGLKWFERGAKLGDLKSALVLHIEYRPEEEPYSILAPLKEWKKYYKARDKSWKYAGIALQANIPSDFDDYVKLGEAAWFTHNDDLAHQFFAKAADNGEYGAIKYVILEEKALEYLTSPKAMYEAGIQMWKRGIENDIHHDRVNGLKMYEKSAKLGYPKAQEQMGYIYLTGQTVAPDTLKAISWYKLAAQHNLTDVMYLLGKLYINGKGIDRDGDKAFEYFKESADSGYVHSELPLGYCYLYGIGTAKNMNKAREYFQTYFSRLNHAPEVRLYHSNSLIVDLDYLIGLTYYFENSPKAIELFEASLKNNTFNNFQRADLLYKLSSCYRGGKCGATTNLLKANNLQNEAKKIGLHEITVLNISI